MFKITKYFILLKQLKVHGQTSENKHLSKMLAALEPLVTYGYCWDIEKQPIELESLVNMLDGKTDIGMLIVCMYL